jgi:hypothetical protein
MRHVHGWIGVLVMVACVPVPEGEVLEIAPSAPVSCDTTVDWQCDVQPILQAKCVSCHSSDGAAPFPLETYEDAAGLSAAIAEAVTERRMPPWPPEEGGDKACPPLKDSRALSQADIDTLTAWAAAQTPRGNPDSEPTAQLQSALEEEPLGEPDAMITVGTGYTPNAGREDDYRCFIVDLGLDAEAWLHAYEVVPSNRRIVHHVLIYEALPSDLAELQTWDDADEGEGFTCFGAPAPGIPLTLGGWVPGQRPQRYRTGDGAWIAQGSKLVVQMHYNLIAGPGTDETEISLYFVHGEPYREVATMPFAHADFRIPAGNAAYTSSMNTGVLPDLIYSADLALALEGVAPHMHTLGTSITMEVMPPSQEAQCLVHVPRWDFHWQGFYLFEGEEPLQMPAGSSFRLTCSWDNSAENQMFVDGQQDAPRAVLWGESTRDEMCLAYVIISGTPGWTQAVLDLALGNLD